MVFFKGTRILEGSTIEEMHKMQFPNVGFGLAWIFEPCFFIFDSVVFPFSRHIYSGHGGSGAHSGGWFGTSNSMFMSLSEEKTAVIFSINDNAFYYQRGWNGAQFLREIL